MAETPDLNDDGVTDAVVGAPGEDVGRTRDAGRAYLVSGADGAILDTLSAPSVRAGAHFGYAVAGMGDASGDAVPEVIVGAAHDSTLSGRAYVISGASGASLYTLASPSPASERGLFGRFPSGIGDVNGDRAADFVVGAIGEDRAYLYSGGDGTLLHTFHSPSETHDHFGFVDDLGDVNGDSQSELYVGAITDSLVSTGIDHAGRAHLLNPRSGERLRTVDPPNPTESGFFGNDVAVDSVSAGGGPTLLVGAYGQSAAYAIDVGTGDVLQTLSAPDSVQEAEFGRRVASVRDLNGDGHAEWVVAAPGETVDGHADAGRVYIFSGAAGTRMQSFASPDPQSGGAFGRSLVPVRASGGPPHALLVGAPGEGASAPQSGRVYRIDL